MTNYIFFPKADKAQDKIYLYTRIEWGEKQAVKYIKGLHSHLDNLTKNKMIWRNLPNNLVPPGLDVKAYFSRYQHHYIFFKELPGGKIGVISILHERSDMPVRLQADLIKLSMLQDDIAEGVQSIQEGDFKKPSISDIKKSAKKK